MRRLLFLLLLVVTQVGAAPAPVGPPVERPVSAPLVALLAHPERFDGKLVTVEGFLNLEFEGDAIYLSRSDFDAMLLGNAIWVDGPKFEEPEARRALSGHYVALTGRFNARMRGHLGMFAGGLAATRIQPLQSRDQIRVGIFSTYEDLPWPLLIVILLPSSVLLAMVLAIRNSRGLAKPSPLLTGTAFLVAGAIGVFSVFRLWEFPLLILPLVRTGASWMLPPLLMEFVVGVGALAASGLFAVRRKLFLCVLFAAVQLIIPAIIEARAFLLLEAPFSIHSARDPNYRWSRSGPMPAANRTSGPDWIDPFAY